MIGWRWLNKMADLFSESQIKDANMDIVGVIDKYIQLKKGGKNYFAPCPFHKEKSGSFTVNAEKQMYYCFGCGAGGNAVGFVMDYENCSFPEAMGKILGQLPVGEKLAQLRKSIGKTTTTSIPGHREDAEKAASQLAKCKPSPTHRYLLMNNTAAHGDVLTLGKFLAVEMYSSADEMVNLAAFGVDDAIHYAAGGISFGATARLKPEGEHDGRIILAKDYAEAWRIWWKECGKAEVRAALCADNFIYMTRRCREQFTHVACGRDAADEMEELGHDVYLTRGVYKGLIA